MLCRLSGDKTAALTGVSVGLRVDWEHPQRRKEWMLNIFSYTGKHNNNNKDFQFWQQDYHPVELSSNEKIKQRLDYLHENPVRSGLVWEPWHYKYSSGIDYYTNEHGLLKIEHV